MEVPSIIAPRFAADREMQRMRLTTYQADRSEFRSFGHWRRAMKFHSVVLQTDARVSERRQIDSAALLSNKADGAVVRKFSQLLRDQFSKTPFDPPAFTVYVDKPHNSCHLDWRQGEQT